MKTFLQVVAEDLYIKCGGDFSHVAVVFPNKRASLFFNEHLVKVANRPIWAPSYLSITDLFSQLTPLTVGEPITLIWELYKVFVAETNDRTESFDNFYHWGEVLLNDFDDADKNCVDARSLFTNIKELHDMTDDLSYLEEGQKEALQLFFQHFLMEKETDLKQRFISIWDACGAIYERYKERLAELKIGYEGMVYRDAVQALDIEKLNSQKYVFIGFNALNKVEEKLFKALQKAGKAWFYWDYDLYYVNNVHHEAGEFMRRNLSMFPSELGAEYFDNFTAPKDIHIIASSTENGQARYLEQWIPQYLTKEEKRTAVVLCNEGLLQPVLHCLPHQVKQTNITMGYPMQQTLAYSFIDSLITLHSDGYNPDKQRFHYEEVATVLNHPYTRLLCPSAHEWYQKLRSSNRLYPHYTELCKDETLQLLFTPIETPDGICSLLREALKRVASYYAREPQNDTDAFTQLYNEALFKAYTSINQFIQIQTDNRIVFEQKTLVRLLRQVFSSLSIPFHGEPAIGMQIMGVLETRNLDFEHLILLSVNEEKLPKSSAGQTFVPYNLRRAFGLTTAEHKTAVFAYYFYRMIQRTKHVTLMYNNNTSGLEKGEQSRFLLQLLVESKHTIRQSQLEPQQGAVHLEADIPSKDKQIIHTLLTQYQTQADRGEKEQKSLSPSALNTYIDCPCKFYYRYVVKLKAEEEMQEDVDASSFGSIFHKTAEYIYEQLKERAPLITAERLERLLQQEILLEKYVHQSFCTEFFKVSSKEENIEYNGLQLLNKEVVIRYIKQLLNLDKKIAPFTYEVSEETVLEPFPVTIDGKTVSINIGGKIDRQHCTGDTLHIVDYKTGGEEKKIKEIDELFVQKDKRANYIFQIFLYAMIKIKDERKAGRDRAVCPHLLYIHRSRGEDYNSEIQIGKELITDFSKYEEEFRQHLRTLIEEIFDTSKPFSRTAITKTCEYCDYKQICRR